MPVQAVANALTVSQFLGIAGAFLAVLFEVRLGRLLPLAIGVIGGAASVYYLVGDIGGAEYWIGVCGFNFLWNLSMPYLLVMLRTSISGAVWWSMAFPCSSLDLRVALLLRPNCSVSGTMS